MRGLRGYTWAEHASGLVENSSRSNKMLSTDDSYNFSESDFPAGEHDF